MLTQCHSINFMSPYLAPGLVAEDSCVEGDVRLMGGSDAKEGRVEVCRNNGWGTVCNDGWTEENTLVVCTQLGLQGQL